MPENIFSPVLAYFFSVLHIGFLVQWYSRLCSLTVVFSIYHAFVSSCPRLFHELYVIFQIFPMLEIESLIVTDSHNQSAIVAIDSFRNIQQRENDLNKRKKK